MAAGGVEGAASKSTRLRLQRASVEEDEEDEEEPAAEGLPGGVAGRVGGDAQAADAALVASRLGVVALLQKKSCERDSAASASEARRGTSAAGAGVVLVAAIKGAAGSLPLGVTGTTGAAAAAAAAAEATDLLAAAVGVDATGVTVASLARGGLPPRGEGAGTHVVVLPSLRDPAASVLSIATSPSWDVPKDVNRRLGRLRGRRETDAMVWLGWGAVFVRCGLRSAKGNKLIINCVPCTERKKPLLLAWTRQTFRGAPQDAFGCATSPGHRR